MVARQSRRRVCAGILVIAPDRGADYKGRQGKSGHKECEQAGRHTPSAGLSTHTEQERHACNKADQAEQKRASGAGDERSASDRSGMVKYVRSEPEHDGHSRREEGDSANAP